MFCLEKCPSPGKTITFIFFLPFFCFPRGKYCTWIPWWLVVCKRWIFARYLSVQLFGSLGVCILQDSRGKFHPCILTSPFLPQAGYSSQDMDLCPATTHMEPQKQSARGGAEIAAKSCIFSPPDAHAGAGWGDGFPWMWEVFAAHLWPPGPCGCGSLMKYGWMAKTFVWPSPAGRASVWIPFHLLELSCPLECIWDGK